MPTRTVVWSSCRRTVAALIVALLASATVSAQPDLADRYRETALRIIEAVRTEGEQFQKLIELCDGIGPRLAGSEGDRASRAWAEATMKADGLENVRQERVMVPLWVRGTERAWMVAPYRRPLTLTTLGGSIGTPPGGIEADLLVVNDFADLERTPRSLVEGRIVLFDYPMRRTSRSMAGYGEAVAYRGQGPAAVAAKGGIACLIRSVGTGSADSPHTGATGYQPGIPSIPAAALSTGDASALHRLTDMGRQVRVRLELGARSYPDVEGGNVIGEIVGRERPDEVVVIGGHLDAWDNGTGAHDDGAGIVEAMETARILMSLGLRPRRTIRVVCFASEEFGGIRGGRAYARDHAAELGDHVAAIESDSGAGPLIGFAAGRTTREGYDSIRQVLTLLEGLGASEIRIVSSAGADIGPLAEAGVPVLGVWPDVSRYFDYHHSGEDTVDNVDPDLLANGTAAMAVMAYVLADMEEPLPRAGGR